MKYKFLQIVVSVLFNLFQSGHRLQATLTATQGKVWSQATSTIFDAVEMLSPLSFSFPLQLNLKPQDVR